MVTGHAPGRTNGKPSWAQVSDFEINGGYLQHGTSTSLGIVSPLTLYSLSRLSNHVVLRSFTAACTAIFLFCFFFFFFFLFFFPFFSPFFFWSCVQEGGHARARAHEYTIHSLQTYIMNMEVCCFGEKKKSLIKLVQHRVVSEGVLAGTEIP